MISVCIPVYNNFIDGLITALYRQREALNGQVEVVVIDDASGEHYREHNRKLSGYMDRYIELDENIGRSAIRNLFTKFVTGDSLLYIDSDSVIRKEDFLSSYLQVTEKNRGTVVVGGSVYPDKKPAKDRILRWKYGRKIESRPAEKRNKFPYRSFITKNVLIPLHVIKKVPFDESLNTYGHEDTLMGYRLKKAGVGIFHVDNCVVNNYLDTNEEFLRKSEEAVKNLFVILKAVDGARDFIEEVKLLNWLRRLYKMKLFRVVKGVLGMVAPSIESALKKGFPSVFLFDLYKLSLAMEFCSASDAWKYFKS